MRFARWASLVIGVLMLCQWAFFLATGSVPEVRSEPVALGFHLAAECATAVALVIAAALLWRRNSTGLPLALIANGMLLYTIVVSGGYFAQNGDWALTAMFAVLLLIAMTSIVGLARGAVRG